MFDPFPILPHQVKNYVLNSVIGQGGFAIVYKATNLLYKMDFAVKVVGHSRLSEHHALTYEAEVNSLIKLDHPNVIRIYDFFTEDDYMFMVLEYCGGGSLEDKIQKNELIASSEKKYICSQIISALKYCNQMSIAHRDIKTSNILFDGNGRVKVADFGLSLYFNHDDDNINKFQGSLSYSSPEVCSKKSFNPFKSDIWSLGVLFYRLFSSSYPFEGRTRQELKSRIIEGFYSEKLKGQISKVVRQMLSVNPDERPTINQLSEMTIFAQTSPCQPLMRSSSVTGVINHQFQIQVGYKRKPAKNVNIPNADVNPNPLAKCINVHRSHSFLTSPLTT